MEIVISLLLCLIIVIAIIPSRTLFPSRDFKKVLQVLNTNQERKTKVVHLEKSILNKISILGVKFMKLFNVSVPVNKKEIYERRLIQAGLKNRFSIEGFWGLKLGMFLFGAFYGVLLSFATEQIFTKWICYSIAIICFFWPNMWLDNTIKTRRSKILREMPVILSSIAIVTESGQSLMQAISEVCSIKEGALIEEFKQSLFEIQMGFSRIDAFERMMDRVQVTELSIFLSSLTQSIEKGASGIGELLKKQSSDMWQKRKEHAKELAEKASIKLFLPLLMFVLPAMMIFLLTPAVISLLEMM